MKRSRIIRVSALGVLFVVGPGLFVTTAHGDCLPVWMPWGCTVISCHDSEGTATETFTCSADTVKTDEGDGKYQIIGQCTHWTEQSVGVFKDASRTDELGTLNGQFDCLKNPFTNTGVSCQTKVFNNTTGANVLNSHVPLTGGLATPKTGQSTGALTTAQKEPYIGVWRSGTDGHYLWRAENWKAFTDKWAALAKQNLRLIEIETYNSGTKQYHIGVWRSGTDGHYLWRAKSWQDLAAKYDELGKQGLRLVDVAKP